MEKENFIRLFVNIYLGREGFKKFIFITFGVTTPPPKSAKTHFFETFPYLF